MWVKVTFKIFSHGLFVVLMGLLSGHKEFQSIAGLRFILVRQKDLGGPDHSGAGIKIWRLRAALTLKKSFASSFFFFANP